MKAIIAKFPARPKEESELCETMRWACFSVLAHLGVLQPVLDTSRQSFSLLWRPGTDLIGQKFEVPAQRLNNSGQFRAVRQRLVQMATSWRQTSKGVSHNAAEAGPLEDLPEPPHWSFWGKFEMFRPEQTVGSHATSMGTTKMKGWLVHVRPGWWDQLLSLTCVFFYPLCVR